MPVYEYECRKCGKRFEARHGLNVSENEVKCPKCGAEKPKRLFSSFSTGSSGKACSPTRPV